MNTRYSNKTLTTYNLTTCMSYHHISESEKAISGPVSGLTIESSSSFSCDVPDFAVSTAE